MGPAQVFSDRSRFAPSKKKILEKEKSEFKQKRTNPKMQIVIEDELLLVH